MFDSESGERPEKTMPNTLDFVLNERYIFQREHASACAGK